ncbi:hypothetical protein T01_9880 [Trichinella spiralis]|uniref:Uncharacterized protein n=1 Tax=Trichinella spiralis TaxID=6334 RepID=A0A0V1BY56_TRISP|nr:hypothetical protein T01_9880 [Trichinella spiralis]
MRYQNEKIYAQTKHPFIRYGVAKIINVTDISYKTIESIKMPSVRTSKITIKSLKYRVALALNKINNLFVELSLVLEKIIILTSCTGTKHDETSSVYICRQVPGLRSAFFSAKQSFLNMRFKHVMSCIKSDTLGLKGVHVSITKCAYVYCSYVRRHAVIGRQIIIYEIL